MAWIAMVRPADADGELRAASAPATCTEDDIGELRAHGFDDRAILDAALTVAYFSFVNRLVLTLGVELESGFEATRAVLLESRTSAPRRKPVRRIPSYCARSANR